MSLLKEFIKGNKVLYPCAKFVKKQFLTHPVKPLDKQKLNYEIASFHGLGIETHPAGEQTSLYCAFLVNIRYIAYLCNVFNIYTFYENIKRCKRGSTLRISSTYPRFWLRSLPARFLRRASGQR